MALPGAPQAPVRARAPPLSPTSMGSSLLHPAIPVHRTTPCHCLAALPQARAGLLPHQPPTTTATTTSRTLRSTAPKQLSGRCNAITPNPRSLNGRTASPTGATPRAVAAAATAAAAAEPAAAAAASPPLRCDVQLATTAAELRAAAFLRAVSFYTYPPGRSEYAARSHRHMKANAEWESVTAKVEGRDVAYRDLDVTCFIATVDDVEGPAAAATAAEATGPSTSASGGGAAATTVTAIADSGELLAALRGCLDACAQLPAEPGPGSEARAGDAATGSRPRPRRLVVGSLDLNVGHTLPSEELIGRNPQADPRRRRAYLSNVCVAPAARRLGVARALLRHVEDVARSAGVAWLYVHVVADNGPAVGLYCGAMGFQVEQSESEGYARSLQRPRRLLLAKCLTAEAQQQ